MAITIPNRALVKPTTTPRMRPAAAKVAMLNPGPVKVSTTGATGSGMPLVEPTIVRAGYYGYNIRSNVPAGASADDESFAPVDGCIVQGFAGVSPGLDVFVDTTARPDPEAAFSGLTHTIPAGGAGERIGVGVSANRIYFDAM